MYSWLVVLFYSCSLGDSLIEIVKNQSDLSIKGLKWTTHRAMYIDSGFDVAGE